MNLLIPNRFVILLSVASLTALCCGIAAAAEKSEAEAKELKPQTTCPVMGGKVNKALFVDVNGFRVYLYGKQYGRVTGSPGCYWKPGGKEVGAPLGKQGCSWRLATTDGSGVK